MLATLKRVANLDYIKLAADATFRELFDEWSLTPFLLLTKSYGQTTAGNSVSFPSWATRGTPLLYAVSSSESAEMYQGGIEYIGDIVDGSGRKLLSRIRQLHGDLGPALECARNAACKDAVRVADFRHVFKAIEARLGAHPEKKYILKAVCRSRTHCTTLCEFHIFWSHVFKTLRRLGHKKEVDSIRSTFFSRLTVEEAERQYGATQLPHAEEGVLYASWWHAYCRIQPGSACGSQAVEAHHAHSFHASFVTDRNVRLVNLDPDDFFKHFRAYAKMAGRQLMKDDSILPDRPTSEDPVVRNSTLLKKVGRNTAVELHG